MLGQLRKQEPAVVDTYIYHLLVNKSFEVKDIALTNILAFGCDGAKRVNIGARNSIASRLRESHALV